MKLLVFVFGLGILYLFIGLGIEFCSCVKNGSLADGIYDAIFWCMLVGGGTVYLLTISIFTEMLGLTFTLPAVVGTAAAYTATIGSMGIVLISGRKSKDWVKGILKGLYRAYGVGSYLSNTLSYSRLLVPDLVTSVISTVFDKIGSMTGGSIPEAIIFILVFLIGRSLNLVINAPGAYIHTSHLQYVKSFGKLYESGGREFEPSAAHTRYYKVREGVQS